MLARAFAQQAPILLLDEPTSALDIGRGQQALELVDDLRREAGLTVLAAMHDLTLAGQYADRLLLLDGGRIVAAGGRRRRAQGRADRPSLRRIRAGAARRGRPRRRRPGPATRGSVQSARVMQRVAILGSGGAGKSVLAAAIAERTGLPVVHLDVLYWKPGWTPPPPEEFAAALDDAVAKDRWILDGNFLRDGE